MFFQGNDCEASTGGQWGRELAALGEGSFDMTQLNNMISGDFYRDTEDTVRGLTLDELVDQPNEASSFGGNWHHSLVSSDFASALTTKKGQLEQGALEQIERSFREGDLPPKLPDDDGFAQATAIYVTDEAAWHAGNRLLTFLNEEVQAHVKKVNRIKFTMKAEVLFQSLTCVVKVRVYRLELSAHVLNFVFEFQRQGGDSLAFSGFFRKARQCLCPSTCNSAELSCEAPRLPPPVAVLQEDEDFDCLLTPLLDAACHAEDRSIQASAAAGLAEAAEDSPKQLCTDNGFVAIRRLMQVESFEVSSQVSRLLSRLFDSREADAYLVKEGMLHLLLDKIWVLPNGQLLRRQLAQALLGFVRRTDTKVSPRAAHDLAMAATA
eukprot:TRINITY_DN4009_c1_g1_i2.p1 TRINITY_DN4009_c1_g1~~TRINITY_DN4009_c1_g1_i2.p1  ORF type:complete len:379 (+),score=93.50 TRINITY_DN4009_c1_g1_i2:101-1237(+)